MKLIFCAFCFLLNGLMALELASPFQDGMVLQSDSPVRIWGWAEAGDKVDLAFAKNHLQVKADKEGRFEFTLPALKANFKSQTLTVKSGKEALKLKGVLVGEVWIVAGQSNMDMSLNSIQGKDDVIAELSKLPVRCLKVRQRVSFSEEEKAEMSWQKAEHKRWSGVGASFALDLQKRVKKPVGIIQVSWGSASIEGFSPRSLAKDFPHFAKQVEACEKNDKARVLEILAKKKMERKDNIFLRTRPNILYNAMFCPLEGLSFKGMLWYQGEANSKGGANAKLYGEYLGPWIKTLRQRFENPEMHLVVVGLPGYKNPQTDEKVDLNKYSWAWMRNAQEQVLKSQPSSLIYNHDLGLEKDIHPKDKRPIGQRAALVAWKDAYGHDVLAQGPQLKNVKFKGAKAVLSFENAQGLKTLDGKAPSSFYLADSSGKWHLAQAKIEGETIVLTSEALKKARSVRYAWWGKPSVNLVNKADLPAWPFRTDNSSWPKR